MKFSELENYHRILVLGICGAGKSTLAKKIHQEFGHPLVHLDQEFWHPGWVETPDDEWEEKVKKLVAPERWIVEGNFVGTLPVRLPRADCVLFLDFNRIFAMYRVIKRSLQSFGRVRADMAEGCPEKVDLDFYRYVWNFPGAHGARVHKILETAQPEQKVVMFNTQQDVNRFMGQN